MTHRRLAGVLGALAVAALLAAPAVAPAAKKHRKVKFTETITGVGLDTTHSVFEVHDSFAGSGAGTQVVVINGAGTGGTDSETTYFGRATSNSRGTFTLAPGSAHNVDILSGTGQDVSGSGKLRGVKSTYSYTGTLNTQTRVYTATLSGTYTLP